MSTNNFAFGVCAAAAFVAMASAQASHAAASQPCVFEKYAPSAVVPFSPEAEALLDEGSYSPLRGAPLFIAAQEGLTKEWLELTLQRALLQTPPSAQPKSNDIACNVPAVKLVQVSVTTTGNGFWVQLISTNERNARELMSWAAKVVQEHRAQPVRTATKH
jgi:hypothetical protein